MNETKQTIHRLSEDIRSAEREMYHTEDEEFFDWDRIQDPMKELAEFGRAGHVEPVREAFRDLIRDCSSGVTYAFAGQYSILTDPNDLETVLGHMDERVQHDLEHNRKEFDKLKQQSDPLLDIRSDCFWHYLQTFFPYLFQFLRYTDRSIDPACIDRVVEETAPDFFELYTQIRTYLMEEDLPRDHPARIIFHSTLVSLGSILQTFYSSLSGKHPGNLDHPELQRPDGDAARDELPVVPEDLLNWIQVRWNYRRPDQGNWTPDPIEGDHPLDELEHEWTFELDPSNQ